MTQSHPTPDRLAAFGLGKLSHAELAEIEEHVSNCETCCERLGRATADGFADLARAAFHQAGETADYRSAADTGPTSPAASGAAAEVPAELAEHPRYRILERIGRGGMGVVYKAEHRLMQRLVALKVINAKYTANPRAVERFRQEVRAAAALAHPHIVIAYDAEQAGKLHFLVMEYVDGVSLAAWVERKGRLPIVQACQFIRQAAQGLQHAHERGMVHRDIKPQNLMLTRKGQVKILDFGLARMARESAEGDNQRAMLLTSVGAVMGTPDYMAPEQANDARSADARSDIYSLGCTLYFLLAGRAPFQAGSFTKMLERGVKRLATPLESLRDDVPADLVAVLARMMAAAPAARYQTAAELAQALTPLAKPGSAAAATRSVAAEPAPLRQLWADAVEDAEGADSTRSGRTSGPRPRRAEPTELAAADRVAGYAVQAASTLGTRRATATGRPLRLRVSPVALGAVLLGAAGVVGAALWLNRQGPVGPPAASSSSASPDLLEIGRHADSVPATPRPADTASTLGGANLAAPATAATRTGRVLFVLAPRQFWWPDYAPVREKLEWAGLRVTVASTVPVAEPDGQGQSVPVDVQLSAARASDYDAVIFCGGRGVFQLVADPAATREMNRLICDMLAAEKYVTAICMGPLVLAQAGVLDGPATGHSAIRQTLKDRWNIELSYERPVFVSGHIITARDDQAAAQFAGTLARALGVK
jgi:putative intracellular protease/amidase/predicted Ser/Thr protein kinase